MDTTLLAVKFKDLGEAFYELRVRPPEERVLELMGLQSEAGLCVAESWRLGALREVKGLGERIEFHCVEKTTEAELGQVSRFVRCPMNLWGEVVGYSVLDVTTGKLRSGLLSEVAHFPDIEHAHTSKNWTWRHDKFACDVLEGILGNAYLPPMSKGDVARKIQVSESTLARMLQDGRLPHLKLSTKRIRPRRDALEDLKPE